MQILLCPTLFKKAFPMATSQFMHETNSNFEQFQEKFPSVEENGRADAHLARSLRSLLSADMPAGNGGALSIFNCPSNAREFHFLLTPIAR
jgi:hypothetical protein